MGKSLVIVESPSKATIINRYLGDDYVLFVTNRDNVLKFVLPYDDRAHKEIEMILNKIEKDYE